MEKIEKIEIPKPIEEAIKDGYAEISARADQEPARKLEIANGTETALVGVRDWDFDETTSTMTIFFKWRSSPRKTK